MNAVLILALVRARRRPGRYAVAALGIAVAVAFGGAVLTEATVAGDQAASRVLAGASELQRQVRIDWSGPGSPAVAAQARATLQRLGLPARAEVVLLSPVRLDGVVVRLVAIAPLRRWVAGAPSLGGCRASDCSMLLVSGRLPSSTLSEPGVRISIAGSTGLRSAAPLGFQPSPSDPPVLVTGDLAGLNRLPALSGISHTHSWLSVLPAGTLASWRLAPLERSLQRIQAELLGAGTGFNFTAPFDALDAARARASAAPRGLLLAGGGGLAALVVFVVLAGGALRRELRAEFERLGIAGARPVECLALALVEAGLISAPAVLAGGVVALGVGAVLAVGAGVPASGAIGHSLLTIVGGGAAGGAWLGSTVLIAGLTGLPRRALVVVADLAAMAALVAVSVGLALGGSSDASALLLAPLACVTAGLLLVRGVGAALRAGERWARSGPPLARVAVLGLARGPGLPALAVAFVAISVGLGGFGLSYRATLQRSAADQAADQVPLDALVEPGSNFVTPLKLAPLSSWRALAGGAALPVRRTEATYLAGGGAVTVPALGVPASGLVLMHGWRASDGAAPLPLLARRLVPPGRVRIAGPLVPPSTRWLSLTASSPAGGVLVDADLRAPDGSLEQLLLGEALARPTALTAAVPAGRWELEALELNLPAGVEVTNIHQTAENSAPPATTSGVVRLSTPVALDRRHRRLGPLNVSRFIGVGAASGIGGTVRFTQTGDPGVLRPPQPSDRRPLPVLVDARTAAAAGPRGELALTVDEEPVRARIVGVLRRFPTLSADAAGFLVADEATLAATLDAQAPGQGRADELWLSAPHLGRLRAALASGRLSQLQSSFRPDIERALSDDPVARGVLGALIAAAAVALALAVVGLVAALLGAARDRCLEADLAGLGVGPSGLRTELRLRLSVAAMTGVAAGVGVAVLLTGLTVAGVGSALGATRPSVVAVVPAGELALWSLAALAALALMGWTATVRRR